MRENLRLPAAIGKGAFANASAHHAKLITYGIALVGPFGSAGAQFLLSFLLLRIWSPDDFGRFSFLLIASQFTWGIWSALFCAPLPQYVTNAAHRQVVRGIFACCLAGALACGLLFVGITQALVGHFGTALVFGAYTAIALLRWLARAHAYALTFRFRTTLSDLIYTAFLLGGCGQPMVSGSVSLTGAGGWLLLASLAGLLPFGRAWARQQFIRVRKRDILAYGTVWKAHARWSLLGVVTTEATANAHTYLVTLLRGPAAFAPLAASSLLIRPITVVMNALTEFERPQMARLIANDDRAGTRRSVRFFRSMLVLSWAGTLAAALALVALRPGWIFPSRYDLTELRWAAALWMAVALIRLLRMPESTLLQSAGAFRPLAFASIWSCGISIALVLCLLLLGGPVWSIIGALCGEIAFALFIWRQTQQWRRSMDDQSLNRDDPDRARMPCP